MSRIEKDLTKRFAKKELVVTRVIDAPREQVFKAWTDPELLKRWWGPRDFTAPYCTIDLRVGGMVLCCMRSPEGRDYWNKGVFLEIVEPERLVMTDSFSDPQGNTVSPAQYDMPDWPEETIMTVTFEDHKGKTLLTVHEAVHESIAERYGAPQGWEESLDCLEEFVAEKAHA